MVGKIDIVMGSFSKTFASNGGFVSCNSPAVKQYLKFYGCSSTFSNAP
jgi:glycine C-acetyltransferase